MVTGPAPNLIGRHAETIGDPGPPPDSETVCVTLPAAEEHVRGDDDDLMASRDDDRVAGIAPSLPLIAASRGGQTRLDYCKPRTAR